MANCVHIWALLFNDATHLAKLCNYSNTSIESIHAIKFSSGAIHDSVFVHDDYKRNVMAHRHFKVIWIMCCSYLYGACTKVRVYKFISDDRNHAIYKRQQNFGANHVLVAWIIGVYRYCAIAHHGFSTSCCNNNALFAFAISN